MERQTITVDIAPGNNQIQRLKSSQGDIGRPLGVYITQNGVALDCSAYTADLYILKPDGNYFTATATVDATEHNLITWETAKQETPVAGDCAAQIRILSNGDDVGTARFVEYVEASPGFVGESSESVVESLMEYVRQAAASAETASGAASSATGSASAASGSASSAAQSASAAAGSASTAHTDAETASQAAQTAQDVAASIPEDYSTLSEDVTSLKSALFDTSTEYADSTLWVVGGVARATGANSAATNRLRLSALQTVLQFDKIVIPDGYRLAVYGWAASGGAYLGLWKDGEGFQTTTSAYNTGEFDLNACKTAGAGKFRLMLFRTDNADFSDATEAGLLIYKTETNNLIELDTRLTDTESNLYDILHQTTKSFTGTTKKLTKQFPIKLYNGRKYTFDNNSGGTVSLKLVKSDGTEKTISSSVADGNGINFICDSNEYAQISVYFNEINGPVTLTSMDDGVFCETDIDNTDYNATSVSLFETIGAIGDSYTSGGIKPSSSSSSITNHYGISWPQILARKCGIDATNYSYTGASIKSFLTNTDGTWAIDKLEADEPRNLYIIVMGINSEPLMDDSGTAPVGSVSDINDSDYTQNGDTFCGHYGQMVQRIINHAPLAKIILVVPLMVQGTEKQTAINEIAAHYGLPKFRMIDDSYYKTSFYTDNRQISHPIGITYAGMANAFERQIIKCIVENTEYFSNYLVP